jgi:PKD repeat protein
MKKLTIILLCLFIKILYASDFRRVEYFIGTDPGFGNGTQVAFQGGEIFEFTANLNSANDGINILYIRVQDKNGVWSHTLSRPFLKLAMAGTDIPTAITRAEYFLNSDPGFGNGISAGMVDDGGFDFTVDLSGIENGIHVLYIRTMDENGKWSQTMSRPFVKTSVDSDAISNIIAAEYFIDTDPGYGLATQVSVSNPSADAEIEFLADLNGLAIGPHTLYVRAKDANGAWSMLQSVDFCNGAIADFELSDTVICGVGLVSIKNKTAGLSGNTVYSWDTDGDGNEDSRSGINFSLYFDEPGHHNISLTVSEGGLCPNTVTKTLVVSQPSLSIEGDLGRERYVGENIELSAEIDYNSISSSFRINWNSAGGSLAPDSLAAVFNSPEPGQYVVTAEVTDIAGCKGSASRTVRVLPLIENFIVKETADVFRSKLYEIETQHLEPGSLVVWESLNPSIATVSPAGIIEGLANGTAIIRGTADGKYTDSIAVTVKDYIAVERIINLPVLGLETGGQFNLAATLLPRNASIQDVRYISMDTSIALISESGIVTAIKPGTCNIISVAADGNIPFVTVLTVSGGFVAAEKIGLPDTVYLKVGDTYKLLAEIVPYYASPQITWATNRPAVATVSSSGEVSAAGAGDARIIASTPEGLTAMSVIRVALSSPPMLSLPSFFRFIDGEQPWQIDLSRFATDDNTSADQLLWAAEVTGPLSATISTAGIAEVYAPDGWEGSSLVVFTVTDSDGLRASQQVDIQIPRTENKAPELYFPDIFMAEASAVSLSLSLYISDDMQEAEELGIEVSSTGGTKAYVQGGNLLIEPSGPSWQGTDTVTVEATDSRGLTGRQSILFTVSAAASASAPRISPIPVQSSDATGVFAPLLLSRYVQDSATLPSDITWQSALSFRLNIQIAGNVLYASAVDMNWLGSERVKLYARNRAGLIDSAEVIFTKMNQPVVRWEGSALIDFFAERTLLLKGGSVSLYPTLTGAQSWKWEVTGNGSTRTFQSLQPSVLFNEPGVYSVALYAQNALGIDSLKAENYITVFGVTASDTVICKGGQADLSIETAGLDTWVWSGGQTDNIITVSPESSRYYAVTVTKGLFRYSDSVYIRVAQPFAFSPSSAEICIGGSYTISASGYQSYIWSSGSESSEITVSPIEPADYTLSVTGSEGCQWESVFSISAVNPLPVVSLGRDTAICLGANIELDAGSGMEYSWSNGSKEQKISVSEAGSYSVTVTDANRCSSSGSVSVGVLSPYKEEIGVCTYSRASDAIVVAWSRTPGKRTQSYELYRETASAGNWVR